MAGPAAAGAARARGPVRSSARLSGGGAGSGGAAGTAAGAPSAGGAAERAAAAAARRARAAERAREVEDSPRVLRDKCRRLAHALRNAKHLVVYTGAGISTAAAIPDYRGPLGVWTRLRRGEDVPRVDVARARPTLTHMALTALWARGTLKFVVSQNCDGLHVRAGLPRRALAELHGDMFLERCGRCRRGYLRAFDVTERTARHAHGTRRLCHACGAELADTIVHFGERGRAAWPLNWAGALRHAAAADVVLCLGSSLKVLRRYPRLWRMHRAPHARPALYIVNLQWTPKDAVAALKINARCDAVMAQLARRLRLRVPRYSAARDPLLAHAVPLHPQEAHTTSRRPLPAPPFGGWGPLALPDTDTDSATSDSDLDLSSPSASDSDDDLPLRRLAERLRPTPTPNSTPTPTPNSTPTLKSTPTAAPAAHLPPPDLLHAFQVSMYSGDATILLRAQHAPSVPGARPSPPSTVPGARPPPPAAPRVAPRAVSELRRFRMVRPAVPAPLNGHLPPPPPPLAALKTEPLERPNGRVPHPHPPPPPPPLAALDWNRGAECKRENGFEADALTKRHAMLHDVGDECTEYETKVLRPKLEAGVKTEGEWAVARLKEEDEAGAARAHALAAAIIARTVLVCRAQLYSGLHTILAGAGAGAGAGVAGDEGECAWCARVLGTRRCGWYGPPPPVGAERRWRRVRGRRYLCACCGEGAVARTPPPADAGGGPGWYGKGCRKGRRPRRR